MFEEEPSIHPRLLANPHVILLPHMGTYTLEVCFPGSHLEDITSDETLHAVLRGCRFGPGLSKNTDAWRSIACHHVLYWCGETIGLDFGGTSAFGRVIASRAFPSFAGRCHLITRFARRADSCAIDTDRNREVDDTERGRFLLS